MAPPQVNLNEKPPAQVLEDPLPGKPGVTPVIVTVPRPSAQVNVERRRQQKRCRIACCASLSFIMVLLLALGTACLVYRMKHRKHWRSFCGTQDGHRIPEHVKVDHNNRLITVAPDANTQQALHILHNYQRHLVAFHNTTANRCYIDYLDETFEEGYTRWQGYEETEHKQGSSVYEVLQPIQVKVVKRIAGEHILAHCGAEKVEYFWVMEVTQEEIEMKPGTTYIKV